ncbi:MAG: Uma2 family endonuclease [Niabella sp.]
MIPDLYIPTYTINDWKLWEGDWELIKGSPVAMSPAPLNKHQLMGGNLFLYLGVALKQNTSSCNCKVLYEQDWIIDETNVVRPDILITCDKIDPEGHITKPPVLTVEIFSKSTQLKDRNTKFNLYEFCGVKYYLMADPDTNAAEVFELTDNKYKQIFAPFHFRLTETCLLEFDLKAALQV